MAAADQNEFQARGTMQIDPTVVVAAQLDAYNVRDLDRFLKCYSEDAVIEDGTGQVLMKGRNAMAAFYGQIFAQSPELHCEIKSRISVGSYVVDEEAITGLRFAGFPSDLHSAVVYRVDGDHIVHVRLLM
jgi:hypothetical protein